MSGGHCTLEESEVKSLSSKIHFAENRRGICYCRNWGNILHKKRYMGQREAIILESWESKNSRRNQIGKPQMKSSSSSYSQLLFIKVMGKLVKTTSVGKARIKFIEHPVRNNLKARGVVASPA